MQSDWKARDAWLCVLTFACFEFVLRALLRFYFANPNTSHWLIAHEYSLQNATGVLRACVWIFAVYHFSHVQSSSDFIRRFGLHRRPSLFGWLSAWVALLIAFAAHYGSSKGLIPRNANLREMYSHGGDPLLFFLLFVISIGPFFEELALRGFLYGAFRGGYGKWPGIFIVTLVTLLFHGSKNYHSLYYVVCFGALWILLCIVRDQTTSLWNCVLCHSLFNASSTQKWPIYVAGMVFILIFCLEKKNQPTDELEKAKEEAAIK
jgi:membrane protease YdiL (CAAX protease family)